MKSHPLLGSPTGRLTGTVTGRWTSSSGNLESNKPSSGGNLPPATACADLTKLEDRILSTVAVEETLALWLVQFKLVSKGCYRIDTRAGAVMYYPTTEKWQHKGKIFMGSIQEFHRWLKAKHLLGSHK